MLDMGFIHDVRKIVVALPRASGRRCCSPPPCPPPIAKLAHDILDHPVRVDIAPATVAVERIEQRVFFVGAKEKRALLEALLADQGHGAGAGLHPHQARRRSRVPQSRRRPALPPRHSTATRRRTRACGRSMLPQRPRAAFSSPPTSPRAASTCPTSRMWSTTSCPNEPESYVHRIGRTARAGAGGAALSFCDHKRAALSTSDRAVDARAVAVGNHRLAGAAPDRSSPIHARHDSRFHQAAPSPSRPAFCRRSSSRPGAPANGARAIGEST